jgi:hypothetical protein
MKTIMKVLKYIGVIGCALSLLMACKDYDSEFTDISVSDATIFNGSVLEYLEQGDAELGLRYDSMLAVINGIPGLRDSLEKTSEPRTVFAIPNACFQEAMLRLNNYRKIKARGRELSLQDFLIEPFVVIEEQEGERPEDPPTIIEHPYDYRLKLDSLISRYIFRGSFDTQVLAVYNGGLNTQDFKFSYMMHILFERQYASGIQGTGKRRLKLSDKNGTQLREAWDRSDTQAIDIRTNNGYIHVLSNGHEFGFSKLIANFQNYGNEYIYD